MKTPIDAAQILHALQGSFVLTTADESLTVIDVSPDFLAETAFLRTQIVGHALVDVLPANWRSFHTDHEQPQSLASSCAALCATKTARNITLLSPQSEHHHTSSAATASLQLTPILTVDGVVNAILFHRCVNLLQDAENAAAQPDAQPEIKFASASEFTSSSPNTVTTSAALAAPNSFFANSAEQREPDMAAAAAAAELGTFDYDLPAGPLRFNSICSSFLFLKHDQQIISVDAFFQLLHPDDRARVRSAIENATEHRTRFDAEFRVVTADDRTRWLRAIGRTTHDKNGVGLRCSGIMIDISREKRTEDALRESEEEARIARGVAEHASLVKDEFLSTLSHELRTPLNTILGWTQVLQRSSSRLSDKASTALATIERSARQQARLIDDLLDASAIIAGKIILDLQPVRSNEIIAASVAACAPMAATRGIKIEVAIDEPGIAIEADIPRMQQILSRLLSNAIKFSSNDAVITVRQFASHDKVIITVSDTGQGIAPAFLPSLFARFTQADGSITRTHMGLGLGLSIVKSLIELHGGHVSASSQGVSRGAVFSIELPALLAVDNELTSLSMTGAAIDSTDAESSDWPADIIVVDDEPDAGAVMQEILQQTGATVRLANSAIEALAMIRQSRPDLLISDIGMPQIDGYQLLRMLRGEEEAAGQTALPAIALTAFARPEDKRRAIEAGYLIHLAKPVESTDLITAAKLTVRRPMRSINIKPG